MTHDGRILWWYKRDEFSAAPSTTAITAVCGGHFAIRHDHCSLWWPFCYQTRSDSLKASHIGYVCQQAVSCMSNHTSASNKIQGKKCLRNEIDHATVLFTNHANSHNSSTTVEVGMSLNSCCSKRAKSPYSALISAIRFWVPYWTMRVVKTTNTKWIQEDKPENQE
jgi:hypothetical protein